MGCQDVIRLVLKYDLKVVILLFMTCFETLNLLLRHALLLVTMMSPKMNVTSLGLEHVLKSLLEHLSLESYLCLRGYAYLLLHVKILLLGGTTMKSNF